jgi:ADP-ribose pyrophosphatase YjhB (NUDIX family)
MKIVAEITAQTLGLEPVTGVPEASFRTRKNVRTILLNSAGKIAIQYLHARGFHKLPGGGVEEGETVPDALIREIQEEVGCRIRIEESLGMVIEHRDMQQVRQISECFIARVDGEIGEPHLEAAEIAEGLETVWVSPEEALQILEHDEPPEPKAHFIRMRELTFVKAYLDTLRT